MQPDRATAQRIQDLIEAFANQDPARIQNLLDELVKTRRDALMLMLLLAKRAAQPITQVCKALHTDARLDIHSENEGEDQNEEPDPAALLASRMATTTANDQPLTAHTLAIVAIDQGPVFAEETIANLLQMIVDGPIMHVTVTAIASIVQGQNQMEN